MLRMVFAIGLLLFGAAQSLRGPFYALLFYLGIAYFRPETWVWGDSLQGLNLSFIVGCAALVMTLFSAERPRLSAPVILILVFTAHGLLATLLSPHPDWAFVWWKGFAKVAVISVLIIALVNTEERFRLTLLVITFALSFEGAKQGWAYLVLMPDQANSNSLEILGDNNGVAIGMLMLSAVILALFQTARTKSQKGLFGFLLIGTLFRSLTTFSRGGLLAFAAMCVVYWWRSQHRIRTGIVVGTLAGALLMLLPPQYWSRMDTIGSDREEMDASAAGRLYFWEVARRMANDRPFLGVGTSGFQASYNEYDESGGAYGVGRAVHSTWFGILADQGYVGFLLFLSLLVSAFRACNGVRRRAAVHPDGPMLAYAAALQTALVTVAVGGTFLSYHYVEILWHFMALAFALRTIAERTLEHPVTKTVALPSAPQGWQMAH
jgi:putative inorganic carbon (HCO3(-)) transporter